MSTQAETELTPDESRKALDDFFSRQLKRVRIHLARETPKIDPTDSRLGACGEPILPEDQFDVERRR